jgi:hypothetical protein
MPNIPAWSFWRGSVTVTESGKDRWLILGRPTDEEVARVVGEDEELGTDGVVVLGDRLYCKRVPELVISEWSSGGGIDPTPTPITLPCTPILSALLLPAASDGIQLPGPPPPLLLRPGPTSSSSS